MTEYYIMLYDWKGRLFITGQGVEIPFFKNSIANIRCIKEGDTQTNDKVFKKGN